MKETYSLTKHHTYVHDTTEIMLKTPIKQTQRFYHDKIDKVSLNPVREVVEMEGGHHLYLENPDGFNQKVVEFCTDKGRRYSNLHGLDEEIGNL